MRNMTDSQRRAVAAHLAREFGEHWQDLPYAYQIALEADTFDLAQDENRLIDNACSVLRARIGGPENLAAYASSVAVGIILQAIREAK